jgi:hypothetical protein
VLRAWAIFRATYPAVHFRSIGRVCLRLPITKLGLRRRGGCYRCDPAEAKTVRIEELGAASPLAVVSWGGIQRQLCVLF